MDYESLLGRNKTDSKPESDYESILGRSGNSWSYKPQKLNLPKPSNSTISDDSWAKMKPEIQQRIIDTQNLVNETKSESEINPLNVAKAVGGSVVDIGKNVGEGIISSYKRVGEGISEAIYDATGQRASDEENRQKLQAENQKNVINLIKKSKTETDPIKKARYENAAKIIANSMSENNQAAQERINEIIERVDPIKGAAAVGSIGFDILTAGTGSQALKGGRLALGGEKVAEKSLTKLAASGAAQGAVSGGLGAVESKGKDVNALDVLQGSAVGATVGGVLPVVLKGTGSLINRLKNKTPDKVPEVKVEAPEKTINRAESYTASETRITKQEAKNKLVKAGYKLEEADAILSDALPDKGLSMPGSPKKVGLNDTSIKQAAEDFDSSVSQASKTETPMKSADTFNPEELSKSAKNSFLSSPDEKLAKPDRLQGKGYSISEAKTGLTQTGEDKAGRIVFGKNDAGEIVIKDGRHLLEAYRQEGIEVPTRKIAFEDGLTKTDVMPKTPKITTTSTVGTPALAERVRKDAIKKKMIYGFDKTFNDMPDYDKVTRKDQFNKATEFILNDPENAIKVAMGQQQAPDGILNNSVWMAAKEYAENTGDVDLMRKLGQSDIVTRATGMGQEISMLADRNPHSAVENIRQLAETRLKEAKKRGIKVFKTEKADMKAIKQATPKVEKETWASFISGLEC